MIHPLRQPGSSRGEVVITSGNRMPADKYDERSYTNDVARPLRGRVTEVPRFVDTHTKRNPRK